MGRGPDRDPGEGSKAAAAGTPLDPAPVRRVAWWRLRWRPRQRASLRQGLAARGRPGRTLQVQRYSNEDLPPEPAADDQGSAHEAVAQPHGVCARLLPGDPGTGVRRPRNGLSILWRVLSALDT